MEIQFKKMIDRASVPEFHSDGAAAVDLRVYTDRSGGKELVVNGQTNMMRTGIAMHISDPNVVGLIVPRSGTATKKGLVLANTVGVIDSDYQGEIMVAVRNTGSVSQYVEDGDRVAQLLFVKLERPTLHEVEEFAVETERGAGGFGSTGEKAAAKKPVKKAA